jgi:hypothetical protein
MSELQITIFIGFVRIFITGFMLDRWHILREKKFVLLSLFLSFIYSAIFIFLASILSMAVVLGFGVIFAEILGDNSLFIVVPILGMFYLIIPFWIEYKNNLYCLEELYDKSEILRATIISHVFSIIAIFLFILLTKT